MSFFEQIDLGRLPLQGPLACFKIGLESYRKGSARSCFYIVAAQRLVLVLVWGESKSCACVWVLQGGAGERRWSADHTADQSSSSCPVLPSCLVVSGALLMAGSLPAIGQDARRGRNLIGPTAQSLLTAGCPAFRAAHTLQYTWNRVQLQMFAFKLKIKKMQCASFWDCIKLKCMANFC